MAPIQFGIIQCSAEQINKQGAQMRGLNTIEFSRWQNEGNTCSEDAVEQPEAKHMTYPLTPSKGPSRLSRLTLAPAPPPMSVGKMVLVNALAHFRLRILSWYMAFVNMGVGIVMTINPEGMVQNPGADVYFALLMRIADPAIWRITFLIIGFARLIALIVNGTFPRIWWTPHVRLVLSGVSALIWLQFAISMVIAGHYGPGVILFSSPVLLELYNVAVATSETKVKPEGHFG